MAHIAKVKQLLHTFKELAIFLNEDEISDIGKVLLRATDRLLKEAEIEGK